MIELYSTKRLSIDIMQSDSTQIEHTFAALADSTRMAIIERLSEGDASLSELASPFSMSQTAVSKHVSILSNAGLVEVIKRGRTRYCSLLPSPLKEAELWLETYQQFWQKNINQLSHYLDEES